VTAISHVPLPRGGDPLQEAQSVAWAARDVGVRVAFAVPIVDTNAFVYGRPTAICACHNPQDWSIVKDWDRRPSTALQQIEIVPEIVSACEGPLFSVQYGPAGPQWVTEDGLRSLGEKMVTTGRRAHIHLLESRIQRQWSDTHYPEGIGNFLDSLGLLTPNLTLAHCVWLTDAEINLQAERGCTAVVNTSSNLRLRSGIAPVARFAAAGLRFAYGLDCLAFNDDEDALFELRLFSALHAQRSFDGPVVSRGEIWMAATANGRFTIDGHRMSGNLEPGADADFMVVDIGGIASDAPPELFDPFDY
jgi:cytosine/adenosine deaminase-related metal-dependent hydrolase